MRVVFTATAEHSLELIGDYIARDDPLRAQSFVRELREKALNLADSPRAFPFVPRYERLGVRRRVHGNYLILYRIDDERVVILHVVHGARDYGELIGAED